MGLEGYSGSYDEVLEEKDPIEANRKFWGKWLKDNPNLGKKLSSTELSSDFIYFPQNEIILDSINEAFGKYSYLIKFTNSLFIEVQRYKEIQDKGESLDDIKLNIKSFYFDETSLEFEDKVIEDHKGKSEEEIYAMIDAMYDKFFKLIETKIQFVKK